MIFSIPFQLVFSRFFEHTAKIRFNIFRYRNKFCLIIPHLKRQILHYNKKNVQLHYQFFECTLIYLAFFTTSQMLNVHLYLHLLILFCFYPRTTLCVDLTQLFTTLKEAPTRLTGSLCLLMYRGFLWNQNICF